MAKKQPSVDDFMAALMHPFKAEVQALRDIIKGVDPRITEQIKWNAPSYRFTDYICTFHLHATQHVHLVFHNPAIASIPSPILEGDYVDRRMAYFKSMADVDANRAELEHVVRSLVEKMDTAL
ncbi:MAG: DUF1801 domain-containing protein [Chloroflexi bacterium]|uniref:DUF1801 domain-containing protein n=1 Tax=Candidatus Flexifilum breve TaxID=3140694 RepID=UPI003136E810|nr:DUF1801 domain-containing protein [Chloroflexota bacterium]MBK9750273.1 DUF1801 domain-containing protein [Chloroflexota bacterium]